MGKYFGTDGIRGVAFEKLTAELAFKVGLAIGKVVKPKQIVIGTDTRQSNNMLAYSLASGAMSQGVDIVFAGVVSTPMIAYYSEIHQIIGVMITASHNPYYDNGIKVFDKGYKTVDELELKIEDVMDNGPFDVLPVWGKLNLTDEVEKLYLEFYEKLELKPSKLHIVFDTANGANYQIARKLFNKYHKHTLQINDQPDGLNINVNCGSTHMEMITKTVLDKKADIGFAFDGDADRCLVVNKQGELVDGDQMIYLFATYLKSKGQLPKNHVVLTKMSNPGMLKKLKDNGITYSLTDVGDKYVFKEMNDHGYGLGGEASGHIILNHIMHSGDGLLSALYLLKIIEESGKTLDELLGDIYLYPLKMINIKNVDKGVLKRDSVQALLEDVKRILKDDYLLLVRPSGTEPLIRVTMSYQDEVVLDREINRIVELIKKEGAL